MKRRLSRWLLVSAVLVATAGALVAQRPRVIALAPGDEAPQLLGYDLKQKVLEVPYEGVTLVNFWSTWCEPCRMEMPALASIYSKRERDGLQIVGVLQSDQAPDDEIAVYLDDLGVSYPVLRLHPRFAKPWRGVSVVPTSFLVNDEGRIMRRYAGALPEQIEGMIRDMHDALDGKSLAPQIIPEPLDEEASAGG
jgi:thiol-disulfide isomerase/thioredoxin